VRLAPYGVMHDDLKSKTKAPDTQPGDWPAGNTDYPAIISTWIAEVADKIWPRWENDAWTGGAINFAERATHDELAIAVSLYHGGGDQLGILCELAGSNAPFEGPQRDHNWHYRIEDARLDHPDYNDIQLPICFSSSLEYRTGKDGTANYPLYGGPVMEPATFKTKFLEEASAKRPEVLGLKQLFQRPRPRAAATALGVKGFRWVAAHRNVHTGQHPAFPSGHCMQGILGGCTVYEQLIKSGKKPTPEEREQLQTYMVDWGDRRVFAGVHYMTDNIASWTLLRRVIPHVFETEEVEELAVQAITQHSRVFADIIRHFDKASTARQFLLDGFPEANIAS
jgi:hypothetical protein